MCSAVIYIIIKGLKSPIKVQSQITLMLSSKTNIFSKNLYQSEMQKSLATSELHHKSYVKHENQRITSC